MTPKICIRCNQNKPHYKTGAWCKECLSTYYRAKRLAAKKEAVEYKGGVCTRCGGTFHLVSFDFHHRDPSVKEANLGNLLQRKGFLKSKDELDKTDLVCRNCHSALHFYLGDSE